MEAMEDSDDEWLSELLRPPRCTSATPAESSDEEWAHQLCRAARRSRAEVQAGGSVAVATPSVASDMASSHTVGLGGACAVVPLHVAGSASGAATASVAMPQLPIPRNLQQVPEFEVHFRSWDAVERFAALHAQAARTCEVKAWEGMQLLWILSFATPVMRVKRHTS